MSGAPSVICGACGLRPAPNEQGKCSECASAAVDEWLKRKATAAPKGESSAERRARLGRMGDADYRSAREGDQDDE